MQSVVRSILVPTVLAAALAGCGGGISFWIGDDDFDDDWWDPAFSGRASTLAVDGSDNLLDGTWGSDDTELTRVLRFAATALVPQTCRFQFYGLRQEGEDRTLDGEVRYSPDTFIPRTVFIGIGPREYRLDGGDWRVDRTAERVVFEGAELRSLGVPDETLTLTGSVPLPARRDAGC